MYGFSSASSLVIVTVAVFAPVALGSNLIWKLVVPPAATGVPGWLLTTKSLLPLSDTRGLPVRFNPSVPVLAIVNVRTTNPLSTSTPP